MKKPWIILSMIIATIMFIYTMSLVSSQNVCSWVRSYECATLQKKANDEMLAKQQADFVQLVQNTPVVASAPAQQQTVTSTQVPPKKNTSTPASTPVSIPTNTNPQQAAATKLAQDQAAAAKLAAQQAAAKLAAQQAAATAAQNAAAAKLAAARAAAQQQAANNVNTTTKAS